MKNLKEKETCKAIIAIHKAISSIDDGYHNKEIGELVSISNALFNELSDGTKKKLQFWFDEKMSNI